MNSRFSLHKKQVLTKKKKKVIAIGRMSDPGKYNAWGEVGGTILKYFKPVSLKIHRYMSTSTNLHTFFQLLIS
jgi:hypothetical protein